MSVGVKLVRDNYNIECCDSVNIRNVCIELFNVMVKYGIFDMDGSISICIEGGLRESDTVKVVVFLCCKWLLKYGWEYKNE